MVVKSIPVVESAAVSGQAPLVRKDQEGGPGSGRHPEGRPSIMKRGGPPASSITGDTSASKARYAIMGRQKMSSRSRARLKNLKKVGGFRSDYNKLPKGFNDWKKNASEVTPPGYEKIVKALKRGGKVTNPWAVAWSMKSKGIKPKTSEGGPGSGRHPEGGSKKADLYQKYPPGGVNRFPPKTPRVPLRDQPPIQNRMPSSSIPPAIVSLQQHGYQMKPPQDERDVARFTNPQTGHSLYVRQDDSWEHYAPGEKLPNGSQMMDLIGNGHDPVSLPAHLNKVHGKKQSESAPVASGQCHDELAEACQCPDCKKVENGVPSQLLHDETPKVPVQAFRDDIQRKLKLRKVMGKHNDDDKKTTEEWSDAARAASAAARKKGWEGTHHEGPEHSRSLIMEHPQQPGHTLAIHSSGAWSHSSGSVGKWGGGDLRLHGKGDNPAALAKHLGGKTSEVSSEAVFPGPPGPIPKPFKKNSGPEVVGDYAPGKRYSKTSEAVPSSFNDDPAGMDDTSDLDLGMLDPDDNEEIPTGDDQMWTKEEVNYRYSGDKFESCGNCVHFKFPGSCAIVAGPIRPVDVCDKFEAADEDKGEPFGWQGQSEDEDAHSVDDQTVPSTLVPLKDKNVVQAVVAEGGPASMYGMVTSEGGPGSGRHPGDSQQRRQAMKDTFQGQAPKYAAPQTSQQRRQAMKDTTRGINVSESKAIKDLATRLAESAFDTLKNKLAHKKGITSPGGLAATIGRKKYGKAGMAKKAAAGRRKTTEAPGEFMPLGPGKTAGDASGKMAYEPTQRNKKFKGFRDSGKTVAPEA